MVTLVVATTTDPASINPAKALLAMPGWHPGPSFQEEENIKSFTNEGVRLLQHDNFIVNEDNLDLRWEQLTGESVHEIIFLSKHTAVSNRPALTVHPIGVPHLKEGDVPPQGGKPGWAALPNPRIGPWLRLLKNIAFSHNLVPEFEITLEGTHHGPLTNKPTMFIEIGSTEEYWKRQDAAQVIALLIWEGLGLGGGAAVGNWSGENDKNKVLLGIGGGHYAPRHMDIVLKDGVWVGHLLSGYSLPMEDPNLSKVETNSKEIGGTWKESIKASLEATKLAFPGGEILAHLDHKSFKSWQKNAITGFLEQITSLSLSLSFFLKNQAPAIHEPSSTTGRSMNQAPRPVSFFTDRSTNQAPVTQILSSRPIHELSSGDPDPFFTGRSTLYKHRSISPIHKHRSISPIHKHRSVSNSDQALIRQDPYP